MIALVDIALVNTQAINPDQRLEALVSERRTIPKTNSPEISIQLVIGGLSP
jgi:hypothetical protein